MNAIQDRNALTTAIADNPLDRVARLALADWLEESGDEVGASRQRVIAEALGNRHGIKLTASKMAKRIKSALGYKGRTVNAELCFSVTLSGRYWDGGTKSDWWEFNPSSGQALRMVPENVSPYTCGPDPLERLTANGRIICERVHFCGKDCGIRVYCHPDRFPELLG